LQHTDTVDHHNLPNRLRQFLDYLKNEEGVSQNEFESRVGFSKGGVSRVTNHNAGFGVDKLLNILKAFPKLNDSYTLEQTKKSNTQEKVTFDVTSMITALNKLKEEQLSSDSIQIIDYLEEGIVALSKAKDVLGDKLINQMERYNSLLEKMSKGKI